MDRVYGTPSKESSRSSSSQSSRVPSHPLRRISDSIGNRALGQVLQTKLEISTPGDKWEREADLVAERIMRTQEPAAAGLIAAGASPFKKQCSKCADEPVRCDTCTGKEMIARSPSSSSHTAPVVENSLTGSRQPVDGARQTPDGLGGMQAAFPDLTSHLDDLGAGRGELLPRSERAFFEPRFGIDFSQVRVHSGAEAAESARSIQAEAYTLGNSIVFGAGKYAPNTYAGRRLLAHELTHVAQQTGASSAELSDMSPRIQTMAAPRIQRQLCEDPDEIARGAAPGLIRARRGRDPNEALVVSKKVTPEEFEAQTGVSSSRLPENTFVGADQIPNLTTLAKSALPAAAPGAAVKVPIPMAMVPSNSIGILWADGHLSIFSNVEGSLSIHGFRGNLTWYIGEMLPGRMGKWFTQRLLTGVPADFMNDRLFSMMGDQSVIYLETDAATARDFATHLGEQRYPGTYRYSPPRPDAPAGSTERAMYERVYEAKGSPQTVMCTNNCVTVPLREVETVLGMHPKAGDVDLATGRRASGEYSPHEHGRAKLMKEFMKNPDLSEGRLGLRSVRVTPGAARAIGYMRVGGGIMMVYGIYETGGRLREAWGTDDFPLVATQEALTWTGGIAGSAVGAAAAGALLCAPAGPVTVACAVGGFLGGLFVGAVGAAIGSLIVPVAIQMVDAMTKTFVMFVEGIMTTGQIVRGITGSFADMIFRNLLTIRNTINPCNWQIAALPGHGGNDIMAMGLFFWSKLGSVNANTFLGLFRQPIKNYQVPRPLLVSIAASMSAAVQKRTGWNIVFTAEMLGELTPQTFAEQLRAYGLLRYRYDPALLAEIQLLPD